MTLHLGNLSTGRRVSEQSCGCGGPRNTCDNRRITAIVRDKDDVMVMFDDCTFMKASFDVVSDSVKRTITADGTDLTPLLTRLEILEAKQDKDTVYDDGALVSRIEALEDKQDKDTVYDDKVLADRVTALETFKQCVCDGLTPINRLNGDESFVAFKSDFKCCPVPGSAGNQSADTQPPAPTNTQSPGDVSSAPPSRRISDNRRP